MVGNKDDLEKSLMLEIHDCVKGVEDNKRIQSQNHPDSRFLQKNIEEEAEIEVFREIDKEIEARFALQKDVYEILKSEHPKVFDRLTELYGHDANKIAECKSLRELLAITQNIKIPEDLPESIYSIGIQYCAEGNDEKALKVFSFLTGLIPNHPQVWLMQGICQQNLRSLEQAFHSFETCITLNAGMSLAYVHMIECLILADHPQEAKMLYETMMKELNPSEYADQEEFIEELNKIEECFNKYKVS